MQRLRDERDEGEVDAEQQREALKEAAKRAVLEAEKKALRTIGVAYKPLQDVQDDQHEHGLESAWPRLQQGRLGRERSDRPSHRIASHRIVSQSKTVERKEERGAPPRTNGTHKRFNSPHTHSPRHPPTTAPLPRPA